MARDVEDVGGGAANDAAPPPAPGFAARFRIPIALAALLAWLFITAADPFHAKQAGNFVGTLGAAPQWSILAAGLFLLALAALCHWRDLGLFAPVAPKSLRLLWLPAVYLLLFFLADVGVAVAFGPPPLMLVAVLLLNTLLAAFSEELMFRGVLFGALRSRLPLWPAILVTTALFGLAHLLNTAAIGNWRIAAAQAVAAAMSGLLFIAIRLRTGSLLPAIAYHALWDFGSLMAIARIMTVAGPEAGGAAGLPAGGDTPLGVLLAPIALLLPNFLYALFLLRRRGLAGA